MTVDHLSLATTPVFLYDGDSQVSQGTGFFYVHGEEGSQVLYLVTNYHVLTGRGPMEKEPPIGDNIMIQFHKSAEEPSDVRTIRFPLYTKDGIPLWIQSESVPDADLAVIPLPTWAYDECEVRCLSAEWIIGGELKVRPASSITLVGYPYGYYDRKNALPIWKTGNLASEPEMDFDGKPLVVVDVSAFPGMSGAPAIAISYGTYEAESGTARVGTARKFIGVYASMQMLTERRYLEELASTKRLGVTHSKSLQLGHVWKARLIDEVVSGIDVAKWEKEVLARIPS